MARQVDGWERIVTAGPGGGGLYESNYLKANSPDGTRGLWLKHNVLRPVHGEARAELWAVAFERGAPPVVARDDVPWSRVHAAPDRIALRAGDVALTATRAEGRLAGMRWDLALSGRGRPLFHFPHPALYRWPFPRKKALTPAPRLRFDGELIVGGRKWSVDGWRGIRGHNWGREHAWAYAYGNCNLWDDGDPQRVVDGFTTRIRVAGRPSPWLSMVVGEGPRVRRNQLRDWVGAGSVAPERWVASWPGRRRPAARLELRTDPAAYVGLRYAHPDGAESYCYNTKFADVRWTVGDTTWTSRCGELEVLFPEVLPEVPLHPDPGWSAPQGAYWSEA